MSSIGNLLAPWQKISGLLSRPKKLESTKSRWLDRSQPLMKELSLALSQFLESTFFKNRLGQQFSRNTASSIPDSNAFPTSSHAKLKASQLRCIFSLLSWWCLSSLWRKDHLSRSYLKRGNISLTKCWRMSILSKVALQATNYQRYRFKKTILPWILPNLPIIDKIETTHKLWAHKKFLTKLQIPSAWILCP